ncbi:hypothetical protein JM946_29200 [Steroidobacter sp. S1-65]|uniref:Uncharacterized protein n=1 Tax=Steroidobacter gossypii TaxID=2805490 RepID=A0ABS1X6I9_9GAMM|nr:hypothetical protein [Steroidobacter gossypii]MBM0108829.1 hypothetical protein [Steroidobacter gossypii]
MVSSANWINAQDKIDAELAVGERVFDRLRLFDCDQAQGLVHEPADPSEGTRGMTTSLCVEHGAETRHAH